MTKEDRNVKCDRDSGLSGEVIIALCRIWGTWEPQRPELLVRFPYPGKKERAHAH
jgi:hypothetical protein